MALPASGPLSISQIATEFGDTAPNSMSEFYRGGSLVPDAPDNASVPTSGQISIGNFYGAANRVAVPLTISANTQNYNVYTQATASPLYTAGIADVTLTIQPGVLVGSSSTGTYALNIPSAFDSGDTVTVVNNGTVIGRGGNGGGGGPGYLPGAAGGGGNAGSAVYVQFPTVFTNNGTLAGGGGGGGGGRGGSAGSPPTNPKQPAGPVSYYGGGGGGGGAGYTAGSGGGGGSGPNYPGGGGSSGSSTAGGGGGSGPGPAGNGGAGGGQGANGGTGGSSPYGGGGGGGVRGYYMVGNPFVTYPATGTRLGQVS